MKTVLSGKKTEVYIDIDGPVRIIGESINPTRRKRLVDTLIESDFSYLLELAKYQVDNGADILDVNIGYPGVNDETLMPEVVQSLQDKFDIPLCLDSPNPKAIEAGLKVIKGKCLINSVNGEKSSMDAILPLAKEFGAAVIGLVMDDDGITNEPQKRLLIAEKILGRAVKIGIPEEDIIIDPLAMAISADPNAGLVTLETINLVHKELGLNITKGSSNISFGLPERESINTAFMIMAIVNGLTCPIANPVKIATSVRAAELLLGRDDFAMRFIDLFQSRKP